MRMALTLSPLLMLGLACNQPVARPDQANVNKGNLTLGGVQAKISNGTTTKAEVLEWFGSPNVITRNKEGEVWNYTRQGTAAELRNSSVGVWFLVFSAGKSTGFSQAGSISFDLLLRFNNNDVVTDHKVLQTAF